MVVVSLCSMDINLLMHRIEPSPRTAPPEAGEPTSSGDKRS